MDAVTDWWNHNWGWLLAAGAVIAPLLIYFWQRTPKYLGYMLRQPIRLLPDISPTAAVKMFVHGQQVHDPYVTDVDIKNLGKSEVVKSDYNVPIRLNIGKAKPVSAWISEASILNKVNRPELLAYPSGKGAVDSVYQVTPELLNPSDWFHADLIIQSFERGSPDRKGCAFNELLRT